MGAGGEKGDLHGGSHGRGDASSAHGADNAESDSLRLDPETRHQDFCGGDRGDGSDGARGINFTGRDSCLGPGRGKFEVSSAEGEMARVLVPAAAAPLTHGEHACGGEQDPLGRLRFRFSSPTRCRAILLADEGDGWIPDRQAPD